VNYTLQGIVLDPGKHIIETYYEDWYFYIGVILFLSALLFSVKTVYFERKK
jgi:hypothetical protein